MSKGYYATSKTNEGADSECDESSLKRMYVLDAMQERDASRMMIEAFGKDGRAGKKDGRRLGVLI